jgi:hypothetical protein
MNWVPCENCGRLTTDIFSRSNDKTIKADQCYVCMEGQDWVRGCKFDECEPILKGVLVKNLLQGGT